MKFLIKRVKYSWDGINIKIVENNTKLLEKSCPLMAHEPILDHLHAF